MTLRISRQPDGEPEIFYSIQGEGVNIGRPSVFLRLADCNLACVWCDTRYAWDWSAYARERNTTRLAAPAVAHEVMRYGCKTLVVTGGEPLLQQEELLPLVTRLKSDGYYVEVETNGTLFPSPELTVLVDHWNVSPKLAGSGNSPAKRERPEVYNFFVISPASHFKFVVSDETDVAEVNELAARYRIPPLRTILMPQARTSQELIEKSPAIIEQCKQHGYLFSTRLQVLLWGDTRGK